MKQTIDQHVQSSEINYTPEMLAGARFVFSND
jgi:hypothetical protein